MPVILLLAASILLLTTKAECRQVEKQHVEHVVLQPVCYLFCAHL